MIAPPTTAASDTGAAKKKRTHGPAGLNQRHLEELMHAEQVGLAAQKAEYAAALALREISADEALQMRVQISAARAKCADALQSETGKQSATAGEAQARRVLVAVLREAQTAAKQKYARTNRVALKDYFVGEDLSGSRSKLEQIAMSILNKLQSDTLPGITPPKITAFKEAFEAWFNADSHQTDQKSDARSSRQELSEMVESIMTRRIKIQFAADAQWPYTDPSSAAVRNEFHLPVNRPFTAR
jgi:hypothetical protein